MKNVKNEDGFSYIDLIIGLVIMMTGMLALTGALTANLLMSVETDQKLNAKQMALSTIESIFSAREIQRAGVLDSWLSVGNVGQNPDPDTGAFQGIFLSDWRPVREDAGWDGVVGTADDACDAPGPCAVPDRPQNTSPLVPGYQRRITIEDDPDDPGRRRITVDIRYPVSRAFRVESMTTMIADYQ